MGPDLRPARSAEDARGKPGLTDGLYPSGPANPPEPGSFELGRLLRSEGAAPPDGRTPGRTDRIGPP